MDAKYWARIIVDYPERELKHSSRMSLFTESLIPIYLRGEHTTCLVFIEDISRHNYRSVEKYSRRHFFHPYHGILQKQVCADSDYSNSKPAVSHLNIGTTPSIDISTYKLMTLLSKPYR